MTVKEIVKDYLEKNGYDGLCSENCGCGLDDFMPCEDCDTETCKPSYKHICNGRENCLFSGFCEGEGNKGDVCYSTEKPEIQE